MNDLHEAPPGPVDAPTGVVPARAPTRAHRNRVPVRAAPGIATLPIACLAAAGLLAVPGALSGQATAPAPAAAPAAAARTITGDDVARRIGVLAHDSMRGRDTPSPELERAAAWIAGELRGMGLEPAGTDGYLQHYPIRTLMVDLDASEITSSTGARADFGEDALPLGLSSLHSGDVDGGVILVRGQVSGATLAATGLEGRHVVYAGPGQAAYPVLEAARAGGAASVLVSGDIEDPEWARLRAGATDRTVTLAGLADAGPLLVRVRAEALLGLLGIGDDELLGRADGPAVRALPDVQLTVRQAVRVLQEARAPNVVAVLPGSDEELAGEYVVFSAHMDHVGVGSPDALGDSIYNGADDNASGTAVVMEVAEAMASMETAPRRSTVFLLVSGEEKGLWGSAHFADAPTVPLERVVANFNADMVGRNWADTIVAIGREHSDLGETLGRVNAAHPEIGMTAIDDLWPEQDFYRRSDHFNFARKGVPVLFFFNGVHADYHRPSDEVDEVDAEKAARIGELLFWLGLEIGDADQAPRWDPDSYGAIVEEPVRPLDP